MGHGSVPFPLVYIFSLFQSAVVYGLCVAGARYWSSLRRPWRTVAWGWPVHAAGLTAVRLVSDAWLQRTAETAATAALPFGASLPWWLAIIAVVAVTSAVVTFGILRFRRPEGWTFFFCLTTLSIPYSVFL